MHAGIPAIEPVRALKKEMQVFTQLENFLHLSIKLPQQGPCGLKIRVNPGGSKTVHIKNIFAKSGTAHFKGTGCCRKSAGITARQQGFEHMGKNRVGVLRICCFQMAVA